MRVRCLRYTQRAQSIIVRDLNLFNKDLVPGGAALRYGLVAAGSVYDVLLLFNLNSFHWVHLVSLDASDGIRLLVR